MDSDQYIMNRIKNTLKRICSQKSNIHSHVKELNNWFSKRTYPEKIISEQINWALRSKKAQTASEGNGVSLSGYLQPKF